MLIDPSTIDVAPFAGAWIEILDDLLKELGPLTSLPSRERGLKYILDPTLDPSKTGRSLRGSVD